MLAAGPVRWSADGGRASADDVSMVALSKQLLHARLAEANLQRKLRVRNAPASTDLPVENECMISCVVVINI